RITQVVCGGEIKARLDPQPAIVDAGADRAALALSLAIVSLLVALILFTCWSASIVVCRGYGRRCGDRVGVGISVGVCIDGAVVRVRRVIATRYQQQKRR